MYVTSYNHCYSAMIQYYSVKHKHTSNESGSQDYRKVESISKELEYVTIGHIAIMQTILF